MDLEKFKRAAARPATAAIVSGAIAALAGGTGSIRLFGANVPTFVGAGIAGAVATEASELAHQYVFPHIPILDKYSHTESMILNPLLQGGIYYGVLRMTNPAIGRAEPFGLPSWAALGGLGAASAIASEYAYSAIEPMLFSGTPMSGGL